MKLLFTDLDGTLLNNNSVVSDKTRDFLDEYICKGNKLILSSGRPLKSVIEVMESCCINYVGVIIIANNGAQIFNCDRRELIYEKRMDLSYVSYLYNKAREQKLHIHTYAENMIVCDSEDDEIKFYRERIHLPLIIADNYVEILSKGPYKMLAIDLKDHSKLTDFCDSIADWAKDKVNYIFSNDYYLEIFDKEAGKGNAVRRVIEYFGASRADSYAAGDAQNDISMLQAAGVGIAMQNAPDIVKKAADVVTLKDNDNDGLAEYMQTVI